jgi:hypothetical protein
VVGADQLGGGGVAGEAGNDIIDEEGEVLDARSAVPRNKSLYLPWFLGRILLEDRKGNAPGRAADDN